MKTYKDFIENNIKVKKIALFGAGDCGKELAKYIKTNYPQIQIVCIFDTFQTGKIEGIEIKSTKELPNCKNLFDLLVVATRSGSHELNIIFEFYNIPFVRVSRQVEQHARLQKYLERKEETVKVFATQKDKDLYNLVWDVRTGDAPMSELENYVWKNHGISKYHPTDNYNKHYIDFVNKDKIETIFDGGFYNGIQALAFKQHFKNLKKLYAFEPMYEKFRNESYDALLEKENFVKIIPFGLWDEAKEIEFCENTTAQQGSRIRGTKEGDQLRKTEVVVKIKTTTIDETVKREGIKKLDFIKLDVEGSELNALKGGEKTILKDRPQMAISIYHSYNDLLDIPIYLNKLLDNYSLHIDHYSPNLCETIIYAIPNELLK